jgi:hypothetical protein
LKYLAYAGVQSQTSKFDLWIALQDIQAIVTRVESVRQTEQIRKHCDGLLPLQGHFEHIWPLGQPPDNINGMSFGQETEIGFLQVFRGNIRFPDDGAETGVGIL